MSEHNPKKTVRKLLKDTKAVSPIIATLLMIVISVVAGVMMYGWISGFMTTGIPSVSTPYSVNIVDATIVASHGDPEAVATGDYVYNWTTMKVVITNPGDKGIDLTTENIRLKTDGEDILSEKSTTPNIVYNMTMTWQTGNATIGGYLNVSASADLTTDTTASVALEPKKTTTFYVQVAAYTPSAATEDVSRALPMGETYKLMLIGAHTLDGAQAVAQETPFGITM